MIEANITPAPTADTPTSLSVALKEWAVAVRALREGRQVMLLRKGGIREESGEFEVAARNVLLFPTYIHADEQTNSLQPCYGAWLDEENRFKASGENIRISSWARITDIHIVTHYDALYKMASQHIYSDDFLRFRIENEPHKPLFALFLRTYDLPASVVVPMEMDYYGCKSWITLKEPISLDGAAPALSDHTYSERVRVAKRLLTDG